MVVMPSFMRAIRRLSVLDTVAVNEPSPWSRHLANHNCGVLDGCRSRQWLYKRQTSPLFCVASNPDLRSEDRWCRVGSELQSLFDPPPIPCCNAKLPSFTVPLMRHLPGADLSEALGPDGWLGMGQALRKLMAECLESSLQATRCSRVGRCHQKESAQFL